MQEIPAVKTTSSDILDQLRSAALVDTSSQSSAFADFLNLMSRPATSSALPGSKADALDLVKDSSTGQDSPSARQTAELQAQTQAVSQPVATVQSTASASTTASTTASTKTLASDASLDAAKNLPVSREAFEELRPTLTNLGLTSKEVEDLSASTQSGQLTWGGLVHTVAGRLSGAKKPVELSASQSLDLQSLFQKLGFSPDSAKGLVADVAKGDGVKVLAQIQQKLSTMPATQTLGLSSGEMSTLFKSLHLPEAAANKLAELFNSETTVAGLKGGLNLAGQELLLQRAQNESLEKDQLRSLAKVMKKDVDKARRETGLATSASSAAKDADSGQQRIPVSIKAPDRNDTKWFDKHDQQKRTGSEDASWREFLARVKGDNATGQGSSGSQGAKDSLDAMLGKAVGQPGTQQAKAETSQQGKAWEKVAAPKLLSQVQEALLKDLGQGRKQLTLDLDPANLGKLQVMLQVKDKDVHATLRADDPETAKMLTAQLDTIKKSLEDQGLKVQSLEVQTGLASRQEQQFFSADQHNQAQERQDLSNLFTRLRMLRSDGGALAQEMQSTGMQAILADKGLHVIA